MEQALSSFSRAEDASNVEVTAKDTSVHELNGTKHVELMDPISPVKLASTIDDQLPSLLSMAIDGLPPLQQSKYVHEAEECLHQYVERYQNVTALDSYCRAGLSGASYLHPGVISVERLVIISKNYALQFLVDDIFFDNPTAFRLDQYGITLNACGSPEKIQEYFNHLDALFSQQVQPSNPAPLIETLMWEAGRDTLELSNPEWFNVYVDTIIEHHRGTIASHADIVQGQNLCLQDLESYTVMRAGNVGGHFIQLFVEVAKDSYIPSILRADPCLEQITMATSIFIGFVNDIFSYHKESLIEQNPRNLITVLMESEGKSFVQAVHMAVHLVNTYIHSVLDMEAKAWNSTLQNHLHDIKALIAGNIYFGCMADRYRHVDSFFPELRDTTSSWKILPHAKGIVEFMDPITPSKLVSTIDDQLPPLVSMVIEGLPPLQQSKYIHEAEERLHQYVEHYQNVTTLDSYCRAGLFGASYLHPGVVSVECLVAISINYALLFLLDDLFFNTPDEFSLDQYGMTRNACGSPEQIQEYFNHLDAVFSQQVQPRNPAPLIETLVWESGRDMLELSNLEWFRDYITIVVEHHHASAASHVDIVQGHNLYFQDLESYTAMRAGNVGGDLIQLNIELANNSYIPNTLRATSYFKKVTTLTTIHIGFVNDIFSYHKESLLEQNPRNLITVLMDLEGKPFVQTVHMAIDLINSYACVILDLEGEAWNSTLQNHLHNIKATVAGSVHFCCMDKRYRHPDSMFQELKDMTSSWKIVPLTEDPRL